MARSRSQAGRLVAEFVVIVTGVLVALAADRWNQGRAEQAAETAYLDRLELDIRSDSLRAEGFLSLADSISAANAALIELVDGGDRPQDLVGTIVAAFQELVLPPPATWNDLVSTGSLALLRDLEVRRAVVAYYSTREEIGLQVDRSVRRGRDPFMDALYPLGIFRPAGEGAERTSCIVNTCFEPVEPTAFAGWHRVCGRSLLVSRADMALSQTHARRLVGSAGRALAVLKR